MQAVTLSKEMLDEDVHALRKIVDIIDGAGLSEGTLSHESYPDNAEPHDGFISLRLECHVRKGDLFTDLESSHINSPELREVGGALSSYGKQHGKRLLEREGTRILKLLQRSGVGRLEENDMFTFLYVDKRDLGFFLRMKKPLELFVKPRE